MLIAYACFYVIERRKLMTKNIKLLKMIFMAMMIAVGVVISPILRVEGMCPMAHFINIICAVMLGPLYAFVCALIIGIIRMSIMGIPPLALTGAVFGAFLSGLLYKVSKGKIIFAVIGEIIGTGLIGSVLSYPIMKLFWNADGAYDHLTWFFYVPSFVLGTLIGGSFAFIFLKKLVEIKILQKFQQNLGSKIITTEITIKDNAIGIGFIGVILYIISLVIIKTLLKLTGIWLYIPYILCTVFIISGIIYYFVKKRIN